MSEMEARGSLDLDGDALVELIRECTEGRCDYTAEAAERGWGAYHGGRPGYVEDDDRDEPPRGHWANRTDLQARLGVPEEVLLAKLQRLIDQGRIVGCTCGCRGDFEVVSDGETSGKPTSRS